jgi:exopolyphosphatase/pppGpp-phosphohydrolase
MVEEATPNTAAPTADAGMDAAVAALEARIEDAAAKVAAAAGAVGASGAQSSLAAVVEEVSALRALAVQCKALFVWEVINEPDEP